MKYLATTILFFSLSLLNACSTRKLVRYEEGDLVKSKSSFKTTTLPMEHKINFERVFRAGKDQLAVQVFRNDPVKEEWEDTYKRIGVYEERCRGWRNPSFIDMNSQTPYCEFDTFKFTYSHLLIIGFFYDLTIPFRSYEIKAITTREDEKGTIVKPNSSLVENIATINSPTIRLTVNSKTLTTNKAEDGKYYFDFKALDLSPDSLPNFPEVSVHFSSEDYKAHKEFANFVSREREERTNKKIADQREKNWPEKRYKKKFCKQPDLFNSLYDPFQGSNVESGCIYILRGPLKVVQVTNGGVLLGLIELSQHIPNKTFFMKTNKAYVDDQWLTPVFVHSTGSLNYNTVLGANRTVHSFQFLGEAKIIRANNFNEDYSLDPNQGE